MAHKNIDTIGHMIPPGGIGPLTRPASGPYKVVMFAGQPAEAYVYTDLLCSAKAVARAMSMCVRNCAFMVLWSCNGKPACISFMNGEML